MTCLSALGCHFPGLAVMVGPHCVLVTVAGVHGARQDGFGQLAAGEFEHEDTGKPSGVRGMVFSPWLRNMGTRVLIELSVEPGQDATDASG